MNRKKEIELLKTQVGNVSEKANEIDKLDNAFESLLRVLLRTGIIRHVKTDEIVSTNMIPYNTIPYRAAYDVHGIVAENNKRFEVLRGLMSELGYAFKQEYDDERDRITYKVYSLKGQETVKDKLENDYEVQKANNIELREAVLAASNIHKHFLELLDILGYKMEHSDPMHCQSPKIVKKETNNPKTHASYTVVIDDTSAFGMPHHNHKYHRVSVENLSYKQARRIQELLNCYSDILIKDID